MLTIYRFAAAAAVFLGGFGLSLGWNAADADETFTVAETRIADMKAVHATVETVDVIAARARIGGTVTRLTVDEGTVVSEGQTIAVVADEKLRLQLKSLQARIDSAAAQRKLALTGLERAKALMKTGTIPQKRLDEAQAQFDAADQALNSAQAENAVIRQSQAEGSVVALASGRILKVNVTAGAVVMPGETVATLAAKSYILRLSLPERHARFMRVGDPVRVLDGATPSEGRIRQVYPELRQGRVIADADVADLGSYFVGERVRVQIATGERAMIVIPSGYTINRFGVSFVKLASGGEVVVQPGASVDGGTEILSGLKPGDVIVKP